MKDKQRNVVTKKNPKKASLKRIGGSFRFVLPFCPHGHPIITVYTRITWPAIKIKVVVSHEQRDTHLLEICHRYILSFASAPDGDFCDLPSGKFNDSVNVRGSFFDALVHFSDRTNPPGTASAGTA
jgi:hypothetical protein